MTEADWLSCKDPSKLLKAAKFRSHPRASRLFAVACCRRVWPLLVDDRSRRAVEVAERHADGGATDAELRAAAADAEGAHRAVFDVVGKVGACLEWAAEFCAHPNPFQAARCVSWMAATPREVMVGGNPSRLVPCALSRRRGLLSALGRWKVRELAEPEPTGADGPVQVELVRCIFRNPFKRVVLNPHFRSSAVTSIATQMYESRDFTAAPILADALQDGGCCDEEILGHLRGSGPHVRGCYVCDMILDKH